MRVAVLYSGGVDSSYLACRLSEHYDVHLLTIQNGFSITGFANHNIGIMKKHYGAKHTFIDISPGWRRLQRWNISHSFNSRKMCLGCRLLMNHACAQYCKDNDIQLATEGINSEQAYNPDQNTSFIKALKTLYKEQGIVFRLFYENKRLDEKVRFLTKRGFKLRGFFRLPYTRGVHVFSQSFCVIGNILYPLWYFGNKKGAEQYVDDCCRFLKNDIAKE